MAFATMSMTVKSEWDFQSLVAKGVKLATMVALKLLTKVTSQILSTRKNISDANGNPEQG